MVSSRTTATGQRAWVAAYLLTEPSSIAAKPPAPREPTTSMAAPDASSASARAGGPDSSAVSTGSPVAVSAARPAAVASAFSAASRTTAATAPGPPRQSIRGGRAGTGTIRSGAFRSAASLAAHSTACSDCSEPSVPTTTVFASMTGPFPVP